jgi:apolipoprotein N-acyltransferase
VRGSNTTQRSVRLGLIMSLNRWTRAALAVTSGLALAAAFPKLDLNLLAWIAFIPLLYALEGESPRSVFRYSWLQGFACYTGSLYWVVITLHNFASVRIVLAVLPLILLAAVLAVYTAVAFWSAQYCAERLRIPIVVTLPVAWTAVEWVRTYFPIGFPWNLLGYTAYRNLDLIQFAEYTGVYGISALIILFNVVTYGILFRVYSRRVQTVSLGALTVLMATVLIFGSVRVDRLAREQNRKSLKVAMVQGNIPQSIKWDPKFLESSFEVYVRQSQAAARRGADLIVWPEAAAAFFFQPDDHYPADFAGDAPYRERLLQLAAETGHPILFGAPALGVEDHQTGFYNRAYLVSGGGKVQAWYDKIQLVPFGEYVPLKNVLGFFVNRVVTGFGDLFPGRIQTIFDVAGARLAVLICYESVFPDLTRREVKSGAQILVNITNDAWYGESSAPYQLLAMAAMRSVETKVPMVRVANTGISAVIEPSGMITAPTPLFKRDTQVERVYWRPESTLYAEVGDVFAEVCVLLAAGGLVMAFFRPHRPNPLEETVSRIMSGNSAG